MGFSTPAFIRKNTPELRKKLEELGYVKNSPIWTDNCSIIWAYQYPVKGFDTPNYVIANSFDIPFDRQQLADYLCIDRAAMSTEISKLQKEGFIKTNRNHFELQLSIIKKKNYTI